MKQWTSLHCLLLSSLLAPAGMAQATDSVPTTRHCTPHNLNTRWVTFGEIGDTVALTSALREAADTGEAVTSVDVEYQDDGRIERLHIRGARSHRAAKDLETAFRAHLSQLGALPKHFALAVARLNATDHFDILPGLLTCVPEELGGAQAASVLSHVIDTLRQRFEVSNLSALIGVWLEASGDVRAIWIERSSGDYAFDQLALQVTQVCHFLPPLVGSRPAPAVLVLPVTYETRAPRPMDRFP